MNNSLHHEGKEWILREEGWSEDLQNVRESQFALGNGYMAMRGILEEVPVGAQPGTYLSGIYDGMGSLVEELVNLPNPVNIRLVVEGEKLGVETMDVVEHSRVLNLKKAILSRRTVFRDRKGRHYDYRSLRFISMARENVGAFQVLLTPLDEGCIIDINTGIDTSVHNRETITEGKKVHFRIKDIAATRAINYLAVDTLEKRHTIIYWCGVYFLINGRKRTHKESFFSTRLEKGRPLVITKIFTLKHFPYMDDPSRAREETLKDFRKVFRTGFDYLLSEHIASWGTLWKEADILIDGDEETQRRLRFTLYHLLICAPRDRGFSSIGARTLTGEGYNGHVFWDTEIFLLPFYAFTLPPVAEGLLRYRYNRLGEARRLAREAGYRGAKFPWESAGKGTEETPHWARDLDRRIIDIHTHKREEHITCDIAYGVHRYYTITGDERFMEECGYELLVETARFWASRVVKTERGYEILKVMGPDEFHEEVNNNFFTNAMVRHNLILAWGAISRLKEKAPPFLEDLRKRLNLREGEEEEWKEIASSIVENRRKDGVIEQFDGYFDLRDVRIKGVDEKGMPLMPEGLKASDLPKTQLIKQPDCLMALYLLGDAFSRDEKAANYRYYFPRTMHRSSLSPSIHSLLANEMGDHKEAWRLFQMALNIDLDDIYGNTENGIHAANLGGVWQAVVMGFCGVRIREERLHIEPALPERWRKIRLVLKWRGHRLGLTVSRREVVIEKGPEEEGLEVWVFGKRRIIGSAGRHRFVNPRTQQDRRVR